MKAHRKAIRAQRDAPDTEDEDENGTGSEIEVDKFEDEDEDETLPNTVQLVKSKRDRY